MALKYYLLTDSVNCFQSESASLISSAMDYDDDKLQAATCFSLFVIPG